MLTDAYTSIYLNTLSYFTTKMSHIYFQVFTCAECFLLCEALIVLLISIHTGVLERLGALSKLRRKAENPSY